MQRWTRNPKRTEQGAIKKRWKGKVPVGLVFPSSYRVGMASLGFQQVYSLLNSSPDVVCERIFFEENLPTRSLESNRGIEEFKLLCFSISFERDYLNVPKILKAAGIPILAKHRGQEHPIVICGGIGPTLNPEPLAMFMDAMFMGEFEEKYQAFCELIPTLSDPRQARKKRLEKLVETLKNCYLPGFYTPIFKNGLITEWQHEKGLPFPIRPAITREVSVAPRTVVTSPKAAFGRMLMVEITRGCGHGCRFCAAGFSTRPPRPWPIHTIKKALDTPTTFESIGLVGLEFANHKRLDAVLELVRQKGMRISFSSMRADALRPEFMDILVGTGTRTATIAAEAGSERLRKVINKGLTQETIAKAARTIFSSGILNLKIYLMLGLPTETDEDINETIEMIKGIRDLMVDAGKKAGRLGTVIASFSTFVPKPWTPFQWEAQATLEVLKRRRQLLKKALSKVPNVKLQLDSLKEARIQGVLSRGDRRLTDPIILCATTGKDFEKAIKETRLSADEYLTGKHLTGEYLPWDVNKAGVSVRYLKRELARASFLRESPRCRPSVCKACGACND